MKYLKLVLAGILVIISAAQFIVYDFLDFMICWFLYSLFYLAFGFFQKFHKSSVLSQVLSLLYILFPLAALILYSVIEGWSKLTETFYIIFTIALAFAFVWEIVSLCLVIMENSDEKKRK